MKIVDVKALAIDAVQVVRFARFCDHRGYFAEQYRRSDFRDHPEMGFMKGVEFLQCNESFSRAGASKSRTSSFGSRGTVIRVKSRTSSAARYHLAMSRSESAPMRKKTSASGCCS